MSRYDYKSLSPQDFEELARDLLQAEWHVALEAFKCGRDQGIDLRYAPLDGGKTIVQCKHYASSSFSSLLSHLRNSELPKLQKLQPRRYVVVTSLPLSPANKDEIVELFRPFVLTTGDVLGADDLNGLLSRHPDIERANFKLWLTSTAVLDRVLHNAEISQTEFEVERIRRKLPTFVQNKSFPRAQLLLDEQRVVIISGVPGIGKTTLAEMLLYAYLEDGYQPVVLQTDVSEGKKFFRQNDKQVFYYDDFLGQTFLGDQRTYVGRNHDAAIVSFMDMVRSTPYSKFILTTREHILHQAFQVSERFLQSTMMAHRCVLELSDYSFGQRARILYNHLYFSDLPQDYKDVVLQDDFFLEIIKHEHFNPRLIEWLASLTRLGSPPPQQYKQSVMELLQSPERLWSHAFDNQISDAGRDLLFSLYTLGEWTNIADLDPVYDAVHRGFSDQYNRPHRPGDFRAALQELDDAFLSYRSGHATFVNPSIREFTAGTISRSPRVAMDLLGAAIRFNQFSNIWDLAKERTDQPLLAALKADIPGLCRHAERVLYGPFLKWEQTPSGLRGHAIDAGEETRLETLVHISIELQSVDFLSLCSTYADWLLVHWDKHIIDFRSTLRALEGMGDGDWFFGNGGRPIYRKLLDGLFGNLKRAEAYDWTSLLGFRTTAPEWLPVDEKCLRNALQYYRSVGVRNECDSCDSADNLSELQAALSELNDRFGIDFTSEIRSIEDAIAEIGEHEPDYESGSFSERSAVARDETVTEEEVREMFRTLKD
ncbi:hypothetical protein WT01_12260 [Burkholderia cepacia]|uniref:nSTAND3 domain-containing NTPase n=1 Tax=Burkholderia cepacia TaxID=292 RepID=UPI000753F2A6|nr:restriction endonuclease [Burkholderia cepacia]KVL60307.1 hypothetical protein WT01_12260 [Burkholderia cepacia]